MKGICCFCFYKHHTRIVMNNRIKKTTYNVSMYFTYEIVLFACNLILPRLIITTYGSEYNGIVSSITQFLNFVSILRLGVAGATRAALYGPLANNDTEKISGIVNATEKYLKKIAFIFLVYLIVLACVYPVFIKTSYEWFNIALLTLILGIGTFSQYCFGLTYTTLLQADQRSYIQNIFSTLAVILNTVISCVLIKCNFSIHIIKLTHSIIYTISPILLSGYCIKAYKLNKKVAPDRSALEKKNDAMAHSIANIIHENTDVLVLTLLTNVTLVSVYSVYNLVMNGLKQVISAFTSGIEAAFGNMYAKGEISGFKYNLSLFEYVLGAITSILFSCTSVLIIPFISIYTRGIFDVNYIIPIYAFIVVLAQLFFCIRVPYLTAAQAAGKYKETKNGAWIEAGLNLSISVLLTMKFGIVGVAIGTLVANVYRSVQYAFFISRKLIYRKMRVFVKQVCWVLTNCAISFCVSTIIINLLQIRIDSWNIWIFSAIIIFVIASIVCFISSILLYKCEMIVCFRKLSVILKRRA